MQRRSVLDVLAPVMFVAGLLVVVFGYGFLSGKNKLPPYDLLNRIEQAARGVWVAFLRPPPFDRPAFYQGDGAISHIAEEISPGITLITAYSREEGFRTQLVDLEGEVLHSWSGKLSEIFPQTPHLLYAARDETIAWHGVHLFPNGDLLFNLQDNSFPYGSGLVRLDKDSEVIWAKTLNTHHDIFVDDRGHIFVPNQYYRADGVEAWDTLRPWYYEDTVLEISPAGDILNETSMLDALESYSGLLKTTYAYSFEIETIDPTHLNNAETLPAAWADSFPMFSPGDLMVSLRNIHTVAVIDSETKEIKWSLTGLSVLQHDPDFMPNGHILLFDNHGGDPACGGSRVVEIDPANQSIVWQFDGCADQPGGEKGFFSETRGMQQLLPNGNVLIAESIRGRVIEVTREAQPRIVWSYHNRLEGEGAPAIGVITHAQRYARDSLIFLTP